MLGDVLHRVLGDDAAVEQDRLIDERGGRAPLGNRATALLAIQGVDVVHGEVRHLRRGHDARHEFLTPADGTGVTTGATTPIGKEFAADPFMCMSSTPATIRVAE